MNIKHKAVFAVIASISVWTLTALRSDASESNNFSRDHVIAAPMVAKAKNDQASSTSWNPLTAATRTVSKAAATAISGARRITKGITGTVGKLFDSEKVPEPKRQPGLASKEASEPPFLEQQSPWPPAITKDQPVSEAEAANNAIAAPPIETTAEPETPTAGIATKASEPGSPPTIDNRSAGKLAAKPAGTDDKLKNPQCERVKAMIRNYAFTDVEATSCEGNIYHFIASRDGKKFSIKVSALKGNLLEVEKLEASSLPVVDAGMPRQQ